MVLHAALAAERYPPGSLHWDDVVMTHPARGDLTFWLLTKECDPPPRTTKDAFWDVRIFPQKQ